MDLGDVYSVLINDLKLIILDRMKEGNYAFIVINKRKHVDGAYGFLSNNFPRITNDQWRFSMD